MAPQVSLGVEIRSALGSAVFRWNGAEFLSPVSLGRLRAETHSAPVSPSVKRKTSLVGSARRGQFLRKFLELPKENQRVFGSLHLKFKINIPFICMVQGFAYAENL